MTVHVINPSRTLRMVGAHAPERLNEGLTAADNLGLAMDGRTEFTCNRCSRGFTTPPTSWHVEDLHSDVCASCANADPDLAHLQRHAEITRLIDAHLAQVDDREHRKLLASMLVSDISRFANWRHEDQEPITLAFPERTDDDE